MSVEWIEHKGKRVLLIDHRDADSGGVLANLDTYVQEMANLSPTTQILYLANFEGATINTDVMARLKEVGQLYEKQTEKGAVVGISGIRNILLSAYNRVTGAGKNQQLFDNQGDALDWLVC